MLVGRRSRRDPFPSLSQLFPPSHSLNHTQGRGSGSALAKPIRMCTSSGGVTGRRRAHGPDTSVGWRKLGKTRSRQEPLHKGLYTCVSLHQEGRPAAEAGRKPSPADRAQPPRSTEVVPYIASWPVMSICHKQGAILTGGQSLMCVHSAVVTQILCTVTLFT